MAVTAENRVGQVRPARGLMAIVDFATRSHARAVIVLVVAALLNILPGFFAIPPTDRDESRFAQATKQMLESGDFIDIRFQETTRYKKPVGIYWLQASVVKTAQALGMRDAVTTIWLYRIPSLLGAVGAVLLTYWAALAFLYAACIAVRRADDGHLHPAQRRGADRQDRRLPAADRGRRHGRDGARLSARAAGKARRRGVMDRAGDLLDGARGLGAAQGAGDSADRRS